MAHHTHHKVPGAQLPRRSCFCTPNALCPGQLRCRPLLFGAAGHSWSPRPSQLARVPQLRPQAEASTATHTPTQTQQAEGGNTPLPQPQPQETSQGFSWTKHWWPAFPVNYLDPARPHALELLGIKMVVWRDGAATWRVFKDACPHRLAALSEGRLESDGTLQCAYHGWRFSGGGSCTKIPQAIDAAAEATACASSRSCATAYPTQELAGLIWVWPESGPAAQLESSLSAPTISNGLREAVALADRKEGKQPIIFMRDLHYGYEILMENLCDPAHLPFSHHGQGMLDRSQASAMPMTPIEAPTERACVGSAAPHTGFVFKDLTDPASRISFQPPFNILYTVKLGTETTLQTELMAIPAAPGRSRVFINSYFLGPMPKPMIRKGVKPGQLIRGVALGILRSSLPWWSHMTTNGILDGDSVFLHQQERLLRSPELRNQWSRAYYLPAQCDSMVAATRRWVDQVGAGGPFVDQALPAEVSKRQILDRWSQHTSKCALCQGALKQAEQLAGLIQAAQAALALLLCAQAGALGVLLASEGGRAGLAAAAGRVWPVVVGLAVPAALALAAEAGKKLQEFKQEFYYKDYVHADMH